MATTFQKLNFKEQNQILVINAPESFESELTSLQDVEIKRNLDEVTEIDFALVFVTRKAEIDKLSPKLVAKARGDVILWFVYPKGTSKKYKADFNRDNGWDVMAATGYQPVRMVAIDEDWSALRYRRSIYVKR
jgi:hypothetical protein